MKSYGSLSIWTSLRHSFQPPAVLFSSIFNVSTSPYASVSSTYIILIIKVLYKPVSLLLLLKSMTCNFFPEGNLTHKKSTISLYVAWKFIRTDKLLSMYPYIYNNGIRCSVRLARTRSTAPTGLLCSLLRGHKPSLTCDLSFFIWVHFCEVKLTATLYKMHQATQTQGLLQCPAVLHLRAYRMRKNKKQNTKILIYFCSYVYTAQGGCAHFLVQMDI